MTQSAIEWTDRSWNPVSAVHGVMTLRMEQLINPLGWRKPTRAFVDDIFHESLPDSDIDKIFAVMALCPQHTFQILTKRPERMLEFLSREESPFLRIHFDATGDISGEKWGWIADNAPKDSAITQYNLNWQVSLPLPNVWLGVSVHDQASADEFVPLLLNTPAAKRFVSYEPALGPVDWTNIDDKNGGSIESLIGFAWDSCTEIAKIDQIIFGGESGPKSRPPHPDWARNTQRQCAAAGTAFYLKQWGDWKPVDEPTGGEWPEDKGGFAKVSFEGEPRAFQGWPVQRVGKKTAGRLLDGVEYSEMPVLYWARIDA